MSKGIIYLAPGQPDHVIEGIRSRGFRVEIDSKLDVDCGFGTPEQVFVKIELKSVPRDLVSSLRQSGRMSRQMIALGSNEGPSILMLVGYPHYEWRYDKIKGERHFMLMDGHRETGLTYGEIMLRQLTLSMIGIWPCYVPDWDSVAETICEFYKQFQDKQHASHLVRPSFAGANKMRSWEKPKKGDLILHIYQGFETIGLRKAEVLWETFGDLRTFVIAGEKYYSQIPGIGRDTAHKIEEQMTARWSDYEHRKRNGR